MPEHTHRILKTEQLHEGWGTLSAVTYTTGAPGAGRPPRTGEVYDTGNAVAVLLHDPSRNTVLLVRQFRIAAVCSGHPDGWLLEACAGKIEDGLSPEETAGKEVWEETGYRIEAPMPVAALYMSPGSFTEKLHLFIATYDPARKEAPGGGREDEGEAIELVEMALSEALNLAARGDISDAKTVLLLRHLAQTAATAPGDDAPGIH